MTLSEFLRAASRRPFVRCDWDCMTWLGAWVEQRHGVNPALAFMGRYRDARGAARIIREAGGMEALIDTAVTPLGIERTDNPQTGDIAVVDAPEGRLGAIVVGKHVANIGRTGFFLRPLPIRAAWRV